MVSQSPAYVSFRGLVVACVCFAFVSTARSENPAYQLSKSNEKVKVFVLAGQSNMEGKGFPRPLVWQLSQAKYRKRFVHLVKDGDADAFTRKVEATRDPEDSRKQPTYLWSERQDVWINYLNRRGNLKVGYGTPQDGIGPELNFGHVVGNHFDQQVLLIKTAWGGRALARGFLPPSSMASDEQYAAELKAINDENAAWNKAEPAKIEAYNKRIEEENKTRERKQRPRTFKPRPILTFEEYKSQYGKDYRNMIDEVKSCLAELKERFPAYRDQGYEIAGFVWFQGWNDQYNDRWLSYEKNLANLIRDVRKDLNAPQMKVVIGQMGHDGPDPGTEDSPRDYIKKAQVAVPEMAEFRESAACVKTAPLWDMDAHAIYTGPGGWSADVDKWRQFGDDRPYHYYGSPWFFAQAGTAFGDAMLKLLKP